MSTMASQITNLTIVYSTVYLGVDQRKHKSSASLAFVWGIHRSPVNSPRKGPVTPKMFHLMMSSWHYWANVWLSQRYQSNISLRIWVKSLGTSSLWSVTKRQRRVLFWEYTCTMYNSMLCMFKQLYIWYSFVQSTMIMVHYIDSTGFEKSSSSSNKQTYMPYIYLVGFISLLNNTHTHYKAGIN